MPEPTIRSAARQCVRIAPSRMTGREGTGRGASSRRLRVHLSARVVGDVRVLVIAGLALLAGACQPMPHPFESDAADKTANSLLAVKDGVGVAVAPVVGLPPTFSRRLGEAVAGALRDAEIPAAF